MTELRVTRAWVREWTDEYGMTPGFWVYRCVGEFEAGRAYTVHMNVTPECADDVPAGVLEEMIKDSWRGRVAVERVAESFSPPPPPEHRG